MRCSLSDNTFFTYRCVLQRLNVCFNMLELVLGKRVHPAARSATGITSFQDFSQLCRGESDPKRALPHKRSSPRSRDRPDNQTLFARLVGERRCSHSVESCPDPPPPPWPEPQNKEFWNLCFAP